MHSCRLLNHFVLLTRPNYLHSDWVLCILSRVGNTCDPCAVFIIDEHVADVKKKKVNVIIALLVGLSLHLQLQAFVFYLFILYNEMILYICFSYKIHTFFPEGWYDPCQCWSGRQSTSARVWWDEACFGRSGLCKSLQQKNNANVGWCKMTSWIWWY